MVKICSLTKIKLAPTKITTCAHGNLHKRGGGAHLNNHFGAHDGHGVNHRRDHFNVVPANVGLAAAALQNNLVGGRKRKGLDRKSKKKVKKCMKMAKRVKSAKGKRVAMKKCMRLKKRLSRK